MKTISLQSPRWRAEIAPESGGNIVRLEYDGRPVLRTPAQAADPYLFGTPILLPANRTRDGRFSFGGRRYQLPVNEAASQSHLHGCIHDQRFDPLSSDGAHAALQFENDGRFYPFPFVLRVDYRLSPEGMRADYRLRNAGDTPMPFTLGLHSCFTAPAWFRVPLGMEQERDGRNLPTGRYTALSDAQRACVRGVDPRGRAVSGYFSSAGREAVIGDVLYRVSENFDHWILYNGGGSAGFLCVEPQCGAVDGLNLPGGHRVLDPGASMDFSTEILWRG